MNKVGLVSVSFRELAPAEIFNHVKNAGLQTVEWGADVHCKPHDTETLSAVQRFASETGIPTCAYGSYYRVGASDAGNADFADILAAAKILDAPIVRVWAFNKGSEQTSADEYRAVLDDLRRICRMAEQENVKIALECHNNTLTDEYHSTLKLLEDTASGALTMYWQPNQFRDLAYNLESAAALCDYVTNVHVFNWSGKEKYPLAGAVDIWKRYAEIIERGTRHAHNYLLEFMPNGSPAELPAEVEALRAVFM